MPLNAFKLLLGENALFIYLHRRVGAEHLSFLCAFLLLNALIKCRRTQLDITVLYTKISILADSWQGSQLRRNGVDLSLWCRVHELFWRVPYGVLGRALGTVRRRTTWIHQSPRRSSGRGLNRVITPPFLVLRVFLSRRVNIFAQLGVI